MIERSFHPKVLENGQIGDIDAFANRSNGGWSLARLKRH